MAHLKFGKKVDHKHFYKLHIIRVMMEAVRTSEALVNFNVTTWHYILEDSKLHTRHCENLKSHTKRSGFGISFLWVLGLGILVLQRDIY
jgi:hypothetical protein